MKAPTLADLVDETEVSQLSAEYGPSQRRRVALEVLPATFDDWKESANHKRQRKQYD